MQTRRGAYCDREDSEIAFTLRKRKRKSTEDTLPACESALHTYRGLFLPHLDILPLRLSEVIPDLLVARRSKDSFDLTDC